MEIHGEDFTEGCTTCLVVLSAPVLLSIDRSMLFAIAHHCSTIELVVRVEEGGHQLDDSHQFHVKYHCFFEKVEVGDILPTIRG